MTMLGTKLVVIASDPPGESPSDFPASGCDKGTMARATRAGARAETRLQKGQSRPSRHWFDGDLCLRRAVSGRLQSVSLMDGFLSGVDGWQKA